MRQPLASLLPALLLCGSAHALDIEHAREMDLDGLRGLGPATTRLILQAREQAPFRDWADLMGRVRGLGPHTAARLSAQGLRVQGQAFTPTPAEKAGTARDQGKP